MSWCKGDPLRLGRMTVFFNADRMRREVRAAFVDKGAVLMPRMLLVTEVDRLLPPGALPNATSGLKQRLELGALVQSLIDADPTLAPRSSAYDLADTLASLMDEIAIEGVNPRDVVGLDVSDESGHWQRSLRFLGIVQAYLSSVDGKDVIPGIRARRAVEELSVKFVQSAPEHEIIVAGSSGSRGTTFDLIQAVLSLSAGRVILPGFDFETPKPVFDRLAVGDFSEDHPQARLAAIVHAAGGQLEDVHRLDDISGPAAQEKLISLALRPAPVTDQWLAEGPSLGDLRNVTSGMTLVEAPTPREEAETVALILRNAVEDGKSAAVITPDRNLSRQIESGLARWGIEPDDSAGKPLHLSPPGRLVRQILSVLGERLRPLDLITLLAHPLTASGTGRGTHLLNTRELELALRRLQVPILTDGVFEKISESFDDGAWLNWVRDRVTQICDHETASLVDRLSHLRECAEAFVSGPTGDATALWAEAAGREALSLWQSLEQAAETIDVITSADFRYLIETSLAAASVRSPDVTHPNVKVWGTLEARVQDADLVVLAGLNEGVWPGQPAADPWLNRRMRQLAGLNLPDRQIGLSAHDFQQAVCAKDVVITRARRDAEAETVPSRWLNRMVNLMSGLSGQHGPEALEAMRARGRIWVARADLLDRPEQRMAPETRPNPAPPAKDRPEELSITDVQRLIRDPYAVYAGRILGLRKLDPLLPSPDARIRGSALHEIMEAFIRGVEDGKLALSAADLAATADLVLNQIAWPSMAALWHARIMRIAEKFAADEITRRDGVISSKVEVKGAARIPGTNTTLVGKADRIDLQSDGQIAIYDYKSGGTKSEKEVHHFEPQLLLEAIIAAAGGFETLGPAETAHVGYISLGRGAAANKMRLDEGPDYDFRLTTVRDRLTELVKTYAKDDQGYLSRRAMQKVLYSGDFDHLARYGEWDDTDIADRHPVGR